jgi:hypothetical protein
VVAVLVGVLMGLALRVTLILSFHLSVALVALEARLGDAAPLVVAAAAVLA